PQTLNGVRSLTVSVGKNVRMTPDQLGGQRLNDIAEIESAFLLRHAGVKNHLQEQVAQFVLQARQIVARDSVGNLIGLLKRIGSYRPEILLQVPRATRAWRAERRHDLKQARYVTGRLHGGGRVAGTRRD